MKAIIQVGAFAVINGLQAGGPTDALYERRCIKFDAERAAKLGDDPQKACSWPKGSKQRMQWEADYFDAGGAL